MATQKKFFADTGLETSSSLQVDGNATIDGNTTITGNLTVNGTSLTVNATTTSVEDNLFELANSNTAADTLDIGIYGNYDDGLSDGGASEYTGLFRDASDSTWKLFDGLEETPTTTINTSGTGFGLADLQVGDLTATTLTATNGLTGSSITYPTSDGTNGQVIKTNGSGTLSFGDVAAGYADSDARSALSAGTGISYNSSTGVITNTVTNTDTDTTYSAGTGLSLTGTTFNNTITQYADSDVGTYLSSNGYATQSTVVAAITDSAPATLDTLNELAAALGDDANFSTTVTNSIALKAPLANPTFTTGIDVTGTATVDGLTLGSNHRIQGTGGLFIGGSSATVFEVGAGTEKMRLTSTGLGIGTESPDKLLEVSGTDVVAKFTGTNANPPQIEFHDSIGVQATIGLNTGHDFIIDTAGENVYIGSDAATLGTSILTVLSTGLVGIGTANPTDPLSIHAGTPRIGFKDTSSNGESFMQLDGTELKVWNTSSAGEMVFGTTNTRRMSISQYGALHIDTAAGYTGRNWVNENTAASPLGGTSASTNTYQKLRLWVDGDINISQGRGLHFGDVTDADPIVIREGAPSQSGVDKDKMEIWSRAQLTLTSGRSRISSGDTSGAGTARSSTYYIKKDAQMGGTWTETLTTPNGGDQTCRIFEDWTGRWVMVGRFAADARTSIQGTWSSVSGLSTSTSQSETTAFSADWGDAYPSEVRIMGCTDVEEYMDTRTIDFVYGNRPGGVHSYTPRQWKHFFAGQNADGMLTNAGGSPRFGFTVGYAYDGKGRWYNPNMNGMGMSDGNTTNPIAAYSTATSNAFNWNTADDAKLLATHYRTYASQDSYQTTGFGHDDNVQGFYDSYPTEYTNMGAGTTGGGVHATLSSAVFVLLKLHY